MDQWKILLKAELAYLLSIKLASVRNFTFFVQFSNCSRIWKPDWNAPFETFLNPFSDVFSNSGLVFRHFDHFGCQNVRLSVCFWDVFQKQQHSITGLFLNSNSRLKWGSIQNLETLKDRFSHGPFFKELDFICLGIVWSPLSGANAPTHESAPNKNFQSKTTSFNIKPASKADLLSIL